jgi:PAS domain S-box-containing protein
MSQSEGKIDRGAARRYGRLLLFLFLGLSVGFGLLYLTYRNVRGEMIAALNERQMLHARQAARGIEAFFQDHIRMLRHLARDERIITLDTAGKAILRDYYLSHQDSIDIITRIDREGRILHSAPYAEQVIGQETAVPEDFQAAFRTLRPVVSDVITNRRGVKSIRVQVPVLRDGVFNGTLAILLPFDGIARRYVEEIRIGQGGYAWVISERGIELSCPVPGHVGLSVFETCRDFPDILAMAGPMMRGEAGTTTYRFDRIRGGAVEKVTKHAVFMPIRLENTFWSIVVATPEDEALGTLDQFRNRLLLIALFLASGSGVLLYFFFRNRILAAEVERRKRTEEALHRKTAELDRYFTSSLDLLCIADRDGTFRRLNPEWEKTLGYPLAELEGKRILDFVHPDDREATLRAFGRLAENGERHDFSNRYRHRDGSYRWIEWRSQSDGKTIYAVARDITQRRRTEAQMALIAEIGRVIGATLEIGEVYERFAAEARRLIPFDRVVISLNDPAEGTRRVAYVSGPGIEGKQAGDRMPLARSINETLIRTRTGVIYNPATLEEIVAICPSLGATFLAGHRALMSVPLIARGEVIGAIHFRSKTPHLYGAEELRLAERIGEQITGAIVNARLFSELARTEQSLRRSEGRLREAQRVARLGHWTWWIPEDRWEWSEEFCRLLGLDPAVFSGGLQGGLPGFVHLDDRAAVEGFFRLAGEGRKPTPLECRVIRPDGSLRHLWVEAGELTFIRVGKPKSLTGIALDITERKHLETERLGLEERLRRAEKMEAIGLLAGGVAHDLNNVLGVLVGYSELLLETLAKTDPLRRYAEKILGSGLKGAAIIQDLLTLARRGVSASETVELNRVIAEYWQSPEFEALKGRHPLVGFRVALAEGLLNIKGSSVHLGKTVMNLVSNAAEAISEDGEVTVRTENRHLDRPLQGYDDMPVGDYVVLTVSDTGSGIPPEDLEKIFEPFYTKKVMGRSGTGLGLAVVWGVVKDHGGYLDVRSREGEGSVFTVYFPVTREPLGTQREPASLSAYRGRGETILVVDDVPEQRELATSMLTRLGYRVSTAASGEEALAWLKANRAELVVLDMIMDPGLDGLETYRRILEIRPGQKAVIVSGFSETERVRQAQALGAGAYVRKPYILENIGLAVRRELEWRSS